MSDLTPHPVQLHTTSWRDGGTWFSQSLRTFAKQPLALGSLFILTLFAFQMIALVPVLGLLIWLVVSPAVSVGLMGAMAHADAGQRARPAVLLAPWRISPSKTRALLKLGISYLIGVLLLAVLTWLAFGEQMEQISKISKDASTIALDFSTVSMGFALYLGVCSIGIMAFTWHAPALVHWYQTPVLKALVFSAMTCIHNFTAMVTYFVTWAAIFVPLTLVERWLGSSGNPLIAALFFPVELLLAAAFVLSSYYTFKGSVVQTVALP